jgi:formyltetrahydrofolate hydrolase
VRTDISLMAAMHWQDDFASVRRKFHSDDLKLYIPGLSAPKRIGLLVSKQDHCLVRAPTPV